MGALESNGYCNLNGEIRAGRQNLLYLGQIRIGLHGSELRLMLNGPKLAGEGVREFGLID